jgi:hypothetical protein
MADVRGDGKEYTVGKKNFDSYAGLDTGYALLDQRCIETKIITNLPGTGLDTGYALLDQRQTR